MKIVAICLVSGVLIFSGCRNENPQANAPTREITDDLGRKVKIPEKVERVVSLAPNLTEIVFAVDAGARLVGATSFCNYPPEAQKIQRVSDTQTPNIESIIALKPQIVLVSTASQLEAFTKILEQQNITYFVTDPQSLDGIYKTIYQMGEIFGTNDKAREVTEILRKRVAEVETRTSAAKEMKVFVQISKEPLFTVGKDSFLTEIIERASGISATKDVATAYPRLSKEAALALQPDAIILSESPDNLEPNEVFKNSPAVKNGKVFRVNADLLSRPSPRIADALEQIAKNLHPEGFE